MSGFLIDTNVISEPSRPQPNSGVITWLEAVDRETLNLSVVTLGELRKGIDLVSGARKRAALESFLRDLRERSGVRILPVDAAVAERWGRLTASLERQGTKLGVPDSLIAATALQHDLTLVTRNVRDFAASRIPLLNPFL